MGVIAVPIGYLFELAAVGRHHVDVPPLLLGQEIGRAIAQFVGLLHIGGIDAAPFHLELGLLLVALLVLRLGVAGEEGDLLSIRGPERLGGPLLQIGHLLRLPALHGDHPDLGLRLVVVLLGRDEGEALPIGRPAGRAVPVVPVGELEAPLPIGRDQPDVGQPPVLLAVGLGDYAGDPLAVR